MFNIYSLPSEWNIPSHIVNICYWQVADILWLDNLMELFIHILEITTCMGVKSILNMIVSYIF